MRNYFSKPTNIAPLAVFRIFFGLIMLVSMIRFVANGWVAQQYVEPSFHFTYYGFEWIRPLPGMGMYLVFGLLIISATLVMLGFFYRTAIITFFLLFTYTELIDKTYYLNHYYFISIVAFLLILLPANSYFSIDAGKNPKKYAENVPRWCIDILKLQLGIVYFYAGLSKLNPDWMLEAMPLKIWLPVHEDMFLIGPILKQTWTAYLFSWFGAIYDLSIPFFLLNKKTRPWAYLTVIAFHMLTWWLFPIGMFPFIMIGATLIYFPATFHQKIINLMKSFFRSFGKKPEKKITTHPKATDNHNHLVIYAIAIHFFIQILLPWRFVLYPDRLFWTEEGYRFSWRVMLMEKAGYVIFHIVDPDTGKSSDAFASDYLTPNQEKMMSTQPDMILQFAHFLESEYKNKGVRDPQVFAEAYVTLNGKGSRLFLDPNRDLTKEEESFYHKSWILPFNQNPNLTKR